MAEHTPILVLASASPNRRALLESVGLVPDKIIAANIDETPERSELPKAHVLRLAREKASAVHTQHPGTYVVAADTIAALGRSIIGKAEDAAEARRILTAFSGRRHRVYSGVCVMSPEGKSALRAVMTMVRFKSLSPEEIEEYIASGQWEGKSGAYGIQSRGGGFVEAINGSYSNVVGLPLVEVKRMLKGLGFVRVGVNV